MQFGQGYEFTTTSIIKETSTSSDYYREPRLINYDITKYYLQEYLKIDKRESYLNKMQEEHNRMLKSINKYKGFYIGRYETGDEISHSSSKTYFKNPKIVRYNSNINYVTWYESYKAQERLAGITEEYVETGMIYGCLWDYTLKWLQETDTRSYEDIRIDSGTWGNYRNIIFKYKATANGTERIKNAGSLVTAPTGGITEITYKGETYRDSPTLSNNIFDLAGNIYECTRSINNLYIRGLRGGFYSDDSFESPAYKNPGLSGR